MIVVVITGLPNFNTLDSVYVYPNSNGSFKRYNGNFVLVSGS